MERTKVVIAQSKSKSLRTTIPAGIARQFHIREATELGWEIEARDSKLVIVVTPLEEFQNRPTTAGSLSKKRRQKVSENPGT